MPLVPCRVAGAPGPPEPSTRGAHRRARRASVVLGLSLLLAGCDSGTGTGTTAAPGLPGNTGFLRQPPTGADRNRAEDLVGAGLQAANGGRYDEAREAFRKALEIVPDHRAALFHYAEVTQLVAGEIPEGKDPARVDALNAAALQALERLKTVAGTLRADERAAYAVALYLRARQLAAGGDAAAAGERLEAAFRAGPLSVEAIDKDPAFAGLRKDAPAFAALRSRLADAAAEGARETVRARLDAFRPFRFDITARDTSGTPTRLASLAGRSLTVVNLWGTWCGPCASEIPHFVALQERYRDRGVAVVGIAFEREDLEQPGEVVDRFLRDRKVTYPSLLGDVALQQSIPEFSKFPTTLFVDPSGTVRLMLPGYHGERDLAAAVDLLLATGTGPAPPPAP
jgi:thiol-disulfide isomerase/thioredoxin